MSSLRVIVVDDESLARKGLRLRLEAIGDVEVVAECSNGIAALKAVVEFKPDVIFLDIQMPEMSGFDVVSNLQQDNMPLVIFVTAFDQYALEAFDVHAVDYLLKPIDDDRLNESIIRAKDHLAQHGAVSDKQRLLELVISITGKSEGSVTQLLRDHSGSQSFPDKLAIKDAGETTLVKIAEIDWIDAAGDYMCVHANNQTHIMRITMKQLEAKLDPVKFQRVHRSTIVNLERVVKVCSHMNGEFYLELSNGNSVKMSRSYKEKVKHFF
ncbi:MAG: two-component system LytT family response regulator [Candidatus Azotimanducaceae bacterium]|jgi:two-component system LytT family response regulator